LQDIGNVTAPAERKSPGAGASAAAGDCGRSQPTQISKTSQ